MAVAAPVEQFDPTGQDVGNIVELGHVNVHVTDQPTAIEFYVCGIGLTRDPILPTSQSNNMWINVGDSQFHLPTAGRPEVICGTTGLVVPSLEAVIQRLQKSEERLRGTKFASAQRDGHLELTCPWGNRIRLHEPDAAQFGPLRFGMAYIEFEVRKGCLEAVSRFYREVMGALAAVEVDERGPHARVGIGSGHALLFRESERVHPPYDGHHFMLTVVDFSGPYEKLNRLGLITKASPKPAHQYRFRDVVDLDTREVLLTSEHELRGMRHPQFGRRLINRNTDQKNLDYKPGRDEWQ